MRRQVGGSILVCLLCGPAPGPALAQQYVGLTPALAAGDEFYYRHQMAYRSVMRPQEVTLGKVASVDTMIGYRLRVLDGQKADHHPLEITIVSIMHHFGRPVGLSYDSRVDRHTDAPHARLAQALLNKPFRVVMRDDGSVISVGRLPRLVEGKFAEVHPVAAAHYRALVSAQTLEQLLLLNLLKDAPEEALVGGTWPSRFRRSTAGGTAEMVRDLTFVLEHVKLERFRPIATVSLKGKISLGEVPESQPEQGPWVYKLSGSEEGELKVDVIKRVLNKAESKQTVKQYMRWRVAKAKMGVQRIVDQLTTIKLQRVSTLGALLEPPRPSPPFPRIPPGASQPAATQPATTQPAAATPPTSPTTLPPEASEPTTQAVGKGS